MLVEYAKNELELAGLFDKDSDYNGGIGEAALEIIKVFAKQGHSGGSAAITISVVENLMRFKPLTPLTSNADEWLDRSEMSSEPMWQSKRQPSCFSKDGGKSWYDIDDPKQQEIDLLDRVFAVINGNYFPREVDSLWTTREGARKRADHLGGMWDVEDMKLYNASHNPEAI